MHLSGWSAILAKPVVNPNWPKPTKVAKRTLRADNGAWISEMIIAKLLPTEEYNETPSHLSQKLSLPSRKISSVGGGLCLRLAQN